MASASTTKKVNYEFTTDDDELNIQDERTTDQETMCDFYKLNLPASASILSRQIAKSQAKRAKKEDTRRRRIDLSTVREQDETKLSVSDDQSLTSPPPPKNEEEDVEPSSPVSTDFGGRSRIDSAPIGVKLKRQISLPEDERITEPMDEEEAQLLAMLLSGIATGPQDNGIESFLRETERKFSLPVNLNQVVVQQPSISNRILPSPIMPSAKVHEWLERSNSPDNVSVCTSAILEDSGLVLQNDEDEDEFFDAEDAVDGKNRMKTEEDKDVVMVLEHDMQGLSLNRNMAAMTQSLVRVEEETTTDGGNHEFMNGRTARSTSVSPRPSNDQFVRNSPGSATFNVKHSSTLGRPQRYAPPVIGNNGNLVNSSTHQLTTTPLSSRTARSILKVHNVNSITTTQMSKSTTPSPTNMTLHRNAQHLSVAGPKLTTNSNTNHSNRRVVSVSSTYRQSIEDVHSHSNGAPKASPPTVTVNPSTPSRPASVASSTGKSSNMAMKTSNIEGLQDLIHMQEEALRRAALNNQGEELERKLSWNSDNEAIRQSTSMHSSIGSLSSSKSVDGQIPGSRGPSTSKIPAPRSRLPTPRGSTLPKRVSIGVQTDIPWPPPCVLRHRSLSMPSVGIQLPMEQMLMNASDIVTSKTKPLRSSRRSPLARSSLVSSSLSCDSSESLASFLLVPQRK